MFKRLPRIALISIVATVPSLGVIFLFSLEGWGAILLVIVLLAAAWILALDWGSHRRFSKESRKRYHRPTPLVGAHRNVQSAMPAGSHVEMAPQSQADAASERVPDREARPQPPRG